MTTVLYPAVASKHGTFFRSLTYVLERSVFVCFRKFGTKLFPKSNKTDCSEIFFGNSVVFGFPKKIMLIQKIYVSVYLIILFILFISVTLFCVAELCMIVMRRFCRLPGTARR